MILLKYKKVGKHIYRILENLKLKNRHVGLVSIAVFGVCGAQSCASLRLVDDGSIATPPNSIASLKVKFIPLNLHRQIKRMGSVIVVQCHPTYLSISISWSQSHRNDTVKSSL
jgi:hypothetical protein